MTRWFNADFDMSKWLTQVKDCGRNVLASAGDRGGRPSANTPVGTANCSWQQKIKQTKRS